MKRQTFSFELFCSKSDLKNQEVSTFISTAANTNAIFFSHLSLCHVWISSPNQTYQRWNLWFHCVAIQQWKERKWFCSLVMPSITTMDIDLTLRISWLTPDREACSQEKRGTSVHLFAESAQPHPQTWVLRDDAQDILLADTWSPGTHCFDTWHNLKSQADTGSWCRGCVWEGAMRSGSELSAPASMFLPQICPSSWPRAFLFVFHHLQNSPLAEINILRIHIGMRSCGTCLSFLAYLC